jgi:8-oxo-dGTP pyrophosphatase MutT (NUDIX family)
MRAWKRSSRRVLLDTPIFRVIGETLVSPGGRSQEFSFLECPDWVNVIAVDAAGRALLITQRRYGSGKVELEIPGGAVDRRDRDPLGAAKRELMEETGYWAPHWLSLGWVQPNPAFHRNRCFLFLALGARKVAETRLEPAEDISLVPTPLSRVPELVAGGRIRHALVVAAFGKLFTAPALMGAVRSRIIHRKAGKKSR